MLKENVTRRSVRLSFCEAGVDSFPVLTAGGGLGGVAAAAAGLSCRDCFKVFYVHKFRAVLGKNRLIFPGEKVGCGAPSRRRPVPAASRTPGLGGWPDVRGRGWGMLGAQCLR